MTSAAVGLMSTEGPDEALVAAARAGNRVAFSALAGERRRELGAAVAELPEKYRLPLMMHYASGRTYREIAVALGLPQSTVVGRLAGALRLLRRRLDVEEKR